jgi:hypothetical protein
MQTIQFLGAIALGWYFAGQDLPLPWIALWIVAASLGLTLLTLVVQHWKLPPAARSRGGLTVFRGQFSRLFFGAIATIVVTIVLVVWMRARFG